ncbi:uncharacterized protein LOC120337463 [Styela clava]
MSFMYKAMMTRGPNKRKIKVNEENLVGLMTNDDEDEEEDEDFTISKENEDDDDESDSGDCNTESSSTDEEGNESDHSNEQEKSSSKKTSQGASCSSLQKSKFVKHCKPKKISTQQTVRELHSQIFSEYYGLPTSTAEILTQAKKQWRQSEIAVENMATWPDAICAVCLDEVDTMFRSQSLTCQMCGISVHEGCYNIQFKSNSRGSLDGVWICDSCVQSGNDNVCQFCPNTWGCLKETKCGRWCHLVCARNILADFLYNSPSNSRKSPVAKSTIYINLNDCNNKMFGAKDCVLCEDRLVSKTGICIKCDAGLCKSTFHVTCAQRHGLLSKLSGSGDNNNNINFGETYYANCPLHSNKEEMKKRQKRFILHLKTSELQKYKLAQRSAIEKNKVTGKTIELRQAKRKRSDTYIPPRPPLEQIPRLLSSDAHFTRLLNNKAEKMFGINTKCPATIIPKATEIRKRHYVAPSLTTDFSAYFVDRELRIEEEKSCLSSAIATNRGLSEEQEWERHKYNEHRKTINELKSNRNDLKNDLDNLKQMLSSIADWARSPYSHIAPVLGSKRRKSITPRKMTHSSNLQVSPTSKRLSWEGDGTGRDLPTSPTSPASNKDNIPDAESIIELKSCGICNGQENQHLLAKCDVCREWQHLACLDPPLTQMPKRTKFSLWQCSECIDTSGSSSSDNDTDNHGTFTGQDGRRVTRRLRRVPDKLAVGFPDDNKAVTKTTSMIGHTKLARKRRRKMQEALKKFKNKPELKQNIGMEKETTATVSTPSNSFWIQTTGSKSFMEDAKKSLPFIVSGQSKLQTDLQKSLNKLQSAKVNTKTSFKSGNTISSISHKPVTAGYQLNKSNKALVSNVSRTMKSYTASRQMRKIIILKKRIISPHRPMGLGKAKKVLSIPSKEIRKVLIPVKTRTVNAATSNAMTGEVKNSPVLNTEKLTTVAAPPEARLNMMKKVTQPEKKNQVKKSTIPVKMEKKIRYCDVCNKCDDEVHIVSCETCKKHYHWECCDPPLKANPVKKWMAWECSNCVDEREEKEEEEFDKEQTIDDESTAVASSGRRVINRKRKPPQVFEPDFNVSTQQKIFRSIAKQKLRKKGSSVIQRTPDGNRNKLFGHQTNMGEAAARCRPVENSLKLSSLKFTSAYSSTTPKILNPELLQSTPPQSLKMSPPVVILPASTSKIKVLNSLSGLDFAKFKTISVIKSSMPFIANSPPKTDSPNMPVTSNADKSPPTKN